MRWHLVEKQKEKEFFPEEGKMLWQKNSNVMIRSKEIKVKRVKGFPNHVSATSTGFATMFTNHQRGDAERDMSESRVLSMEVH